MCFRYDCSFIMPNTSDSVELAVLEHLQKGQLLLQKSQREAGIQAEVNKFKGAGTKRAVKFTKELLFQCEDLADIFKVEEGEEFATKDNLDDVNKAVIKFNTLLEDHKKSIQHELNMQIVAASSPLKWKTVKQLEGGLELPACVTIDSMRFGKRRRILWRLPGTSVLLRRDLWRVLPLGPSVSEEGVEVEVVVYTTEEGGVEALQETAPGLVLSVVTWAT